MVKNLDIIVCGVAEVNDYIDDVDIVVSIMNPGDTIFATQSISEKENENRHQVLRLEFDDVWAENYQLGQEIVTKDMIAHVIDFVSTYYDNAEDTLTVLIHCHQGVSRSAGMAIAVYTAILGDYQEAVKRVVCDRVQAVPNIEIIRLTDEMLNLDGKLIDTAWEQFYPSYLDQANLN
jgi:predicted protein tyrosine phosphatase